MWLMAPSEDLFVGLLQGGTFDEHRSLVRFAYDPIDWDLFDQFAQNTSSVLSIRPVTGHCPLHIKAAKAAR